MPEPQNNKHEANWAWWQSNSLKSFSDNKYVSPRDSQSFANLRCCCLLCFSHLNLTAADASWQLTASARRQPCPSLGWQAQLRRPPKLALRLFGNNRKKKKKSNHCHCVNNYHPPFHPMHSFYSIQSSNREPDCFPAPHRSASAVCSVPRKTHHLFKVRMQSCCASCEPQLQGTTHTWIVSLQVWDEAGSLGCPHGRALFVTDGKYL